MSFVSKLGARSRPFIDGYRSMPARAIIKAGGSGFSGEDHGVGGGREEVAPPPDVPPPDVPPPDVPPLDSPVSSPRGSSRSEGKGEEMPDPDKDAAMGAVRGAVTAVKKVAAPLRDLLKRWGVISSEGEVRNDVVDQAAEMAIPLEDVLKMKAREFKAVEEADAAEAIARGEGVAESKDVVMGEMVVNPQQIVSAMDTMNLARALDLQTRELVGRLETIAEDTSLETVGEKRDRFSILLDKLVGEREEETFDQLLDDITRVDYKTAFIEVERFRNNLRRLRSEFNVAGLHHTPALDGLFDSANNSLEEIGENIESARKDAEERAFAKRAVEAMEQEQAAAAQAKAAAKAREDAKTAGLRRMAFEALSPAERVAMAEKMQLKKTREEEEKQRRKQVRAFRAAQKLSNRGQLPASSKRRSKP